MKHDGVVTLLSENQTTSKKFDPARIGLVGVIVFDLGMSEGEDQIPVVILKVLPGNGYSFFNIHATVLFRFQKHFFYFMILL